MRLKKRIRPLIVLLLTLVMLPLGIRSAAAYAPGDREARYLDCWTVGQTRDVSASYYTGYYTYIQVVGAAYGNGHTNPSNCKVKIKVFYQVPGSSETLNRIYIFDVPGKTTLKSDALSPSSQGVRLRGMDVTACLAGCGTTVSVRYPNP